MTRVIHYGIPMVGLRDKKLPGKLIVVEGTDGGGRLDADRTAAGMAGSQWLRHHRNRFDPFEPGRGRNQEGEARPHDGRPNYEFVLLHRFRGSAGEANHPGAAGGICRAETGTSIPSLPARRRAGRIQMGPRRTGIRAIPDVVPYLRIDVENLIPRVVNSAESTIGVPAWMTCAGTISQQ